jgi:hypothetical protein
MVERERRKSLISPIRRGSGWSRNRRPDTLGGAELSKLIDSYARALQSVEFEERPSELEEAIEGGPGRLAAAEPEGRLGEVVRQYLAAETGAARLGYILVVSHVGLTPKSRHWEQFATGPGSRCNGANLLRRSRAQSLRHPRLGRVPHPRSRCATSAY